MPRVVVFDAQPRARVEYTLTDLCTGGRTKSPHRGEEQQIRGRRRVAVPADALDARVAETAALLRRLRESGDVASDRAARRTPAGLPVSRHV